MTKKSDSCLFRSLIDSCFEVTKLIQGSDCWNKPQAWQRISGVSRWIMQCVSAVHAALEGPFVFPPSWILEQLPPTLSPQTITFHCFHCMCGHHGLQPGPAHVRVLTILWWKGDRESDAKCKNAAQVKQDETCHGVSLWRSAVKTFASVFRNTTQIETHRLNLEWFWEGPGAASVNSCSASFVTR